MKSTRIDIASIRKEQIVEAAMAVINEQGLHHLSLSEIETKAAMSRGQLTYYFETKEDILLAVFERVLQLMYQRLGQPPGTAECGEDEHSGWQVTRYLLETMFTKPPLSPEFHCLQYTFLAQIGYREDFRQCLATLYETWRTRMSEGFEADLARNPGTKDVNPRALATVFQALMHGLTMQMATDPKAVDGPAVLELCLDILARYLGQNEAEPRAGKAEAKSPRPGKTRGKKINGAAPSKG